MNTIETIQAKVASIRHHSGNKYIIQLVSGGTEYVVAFDDNGQMFIYDTADRYFGKDIDHEISGKEILAIESAVCVRKKVYRKLYGAMEFFWR